MIDRKKTIPVWKKICFYFLGILYLADKVENASRFQIILFVLLMYERADGAKTLHHFEKVRTCLFRYARGGHHYGVL